MGDYAPEDGVETGRTGLNAAALEAMWADTGAFLKKSLGKGAYDSWIAPLSLTRIDNGLARVSAPTPFMRNWVATQYADAVRRALAAADPRIERVEFEAADARPAKSKAPEAPNRSAAPGAPHVAKPQPATDRADAPLPPHAAMNGASNGADILPSSALDPRFTFDSFVVGKPNELAHAAARRVAESAEVTFNPLFLYGGVGLGKTHLMHAIAWELSQRHQGRRVLYLSAEQFMYRFVQALRYRDTISFKQQFRSVDVLMVDDVQFIAGKDSTQEEFFHTFNALIDQSKQIVISADRSPNEIDGLEERIRSRLQWGLVVDIHPTDYELRLGILHAKAETVALQNPGLVLDAKVLEFLAHRISSNVRVLEGALTRLVAFATLVGRPIDLDMAQECLADILRASDRKVTVDEIIRKCCQHYNIRMTDMLSPRRARAVARPRQIAMYLAKMLTQKSLPDIGRKFGGRDHTTVLHAVRKIEQLCETDSALAEDIELLRRMLEA